MLFVQLHVDQEEDESIIWGQLGGFEERSGRTGTRHAWGQSQENLPESWSPELEMPQGGRSSPLVHHTGKHQRRKLFDLNKANAKTNQ